MAELIDEKKVIRISLGYLATILATIIGATIFLVSLRGDVLILLDQVQKHQVMLEKNQETIIEMQIDMKQFRQTYERDMNNYFREHPSQNR